MFNNTFEQLFLPAGIAADDRNIPRQGTTSC